MDQQMNHSQQAAADRTQARRFRASLPKRKVPKGQTFIPTIVLQRLAALHLPKNRNVYNARLRELLRAAQ
jgi:hypothetical protein